MGMPLRVLVVEDSENDALLTIGELRRGGLDPESQRVETADAMRSALEGNSWDVIISDHQLPRFSGMDALEIRNELCPDIPFIIVSGTIGEDVAVAAMKKGANDYLLKGNLKRLVVAVEREIRDAAERQARKKAEVALAQLQKLDAIGRLAGGVAHDFNNIMSVIIGYSELLIGRTKSSDRDAEQLQEIRKAGLRATALTRQLLAFSRKQLLVPHVLDLNEVVGNIEKLLGRLIGENVELVTVQAPGLGHIKADPGQLEQVIMNLAINARDAMPDGGRLTIETSNVDLDEPYAQAHVGVHPGRYVRLAVSDTGCGMSAETRAHLFEPFFTTKESGKGTGLGLATAYGIIKQSSGNIWVYSELGRGTTFKIYIPRVDEPVTEAQVAAPRAGPAKGSETILLVEDEEAVRALARTVLSMNGYTVLEAKDGVEALEILRARGRSITLVLTDTVMPRMGGPELGGQLAGIFPGMKILYMSGYTQESVVGQSKAYLEKPFTPAALARKVRDVLDAPTGPGNS